MAEDLLRVGSRTFRSRILLGTGKYPDFETMNRALDASGCECVTVAVRRANLGREGGPSLLDALDLQRYAILPNTAGCFTAEDAIRTAHLAREFGLSDMVKVEVLADPKTLLPDPVGTLEAVRRLAKDGFTVLVYTSDDPILAQRLEEAMELGADGVLMNTGVALACDPVAMATAMRHAWIAGRAAWKAGRIPRREWAQASSPTTGTIAAPPGVPGE